MQTNFFFILEYVPVIHTCKDICRPCLSMGRRWGELMRFRSLWTRSTNPWWRVPLTESSPDGKPPWGTDQERRFKSHMLQCNVWQSTSARGGKVEAHEVYEWLVKCSLFLNWNTSTVTHDIPPWLEQDALGVTVAGTLLKEARGLFGPLVLLWWSNLFNFVDTLFVIRMRLIKFDTAVFEILSMKLICLWWVGQ